MPQICKGREMMMMMMMDVGQGRKGMEVSAD
jgi:hypothetical protein